MAMHRIALQLRLALCGLALTVGGCASFNAMPRPVLDIDKTVALAQSTYGIETALANFTTAPDKKAYRNRVILYHLAAADLRYLEFRTALSREVKGSNLGLDMAVLGLTGVGAIANSAANELSAAASALTGTRAAINRELYFQQTLPALIASMDASRMKLKIEIVKRMQLPVADYPLEQAFTDVIAYQMSASLDGAIQSVTVAAAADAAQQQRNYDNITIAYASCDVDDPTGDLWLRIRSGIIATTDVAQLNDIATIMSLEPARIKEAGVIGKALNDRYCSVTAAQELIDAIQAKTGRTF